MILINEVFAERLTNGVLTISPGNYQSVPVTVTGDQFGSGWYNASRTVTRTESALIMLTIDNCRVIVSMLVTDRAVWPRC